MIKLCGSSLPAVLCGWGLNRDYTLNSLVTAVSLPFPGSHPRKGPKNQKINKKKPQPLKDLHRDTRALLSGPRGAGAGRAAMAAGGAAAPPLRRRCGGGGGRRDANWSRHAAPPSSPGSPRRLAVPGRPPPGKVLPPGGRPQARGEAVEPRRAVWCGVVPARRPCWPPAGGRGGGRAPPGRDEAESLRVIIKLPGPARFFLIKSKSRGLRVRIAVHVNIKGRGGAGPAPRALLR